MGLARELILAEAAELLTAFRFMSFNVAGTASDLECAIEDGPAVMAAKAEHFTKAGQFTEPDNYSWSRIVLPNAVGAAS